MHFPVVFIDTCSKTKKPKKNWDQISNPLKIKQHTYIFINVLLYLCWIDSYLSYHTISIQYVHFHSISVCSPVIVSLNWHEYFYSPFPALPTIWAPSFLFGLWQVACRILVPRPRMEPMLPAVEAWSLNHWTVREVPEHPPFTKICVNMPVWNRHYLGVFGFWSHIFEHLTFLSLSFLVFKRNILIPTL